MPLRIINFFNNTNLGTFKQNVFHYARERSTDQNLGSILKFSKRKRPEHLVIKKY
jgi:hypothetical protein